MVINHGKSRSVILNFPQFYAARTQEIVMLKLGSIFLQTKKSNTLKIVIKVFILIFHKDDKINESFVLCFIEIVSFQMKNCNEWLLAWYTFPIPHCISVFEKKFVEFLFTTWSWIERTLPFFGKTSQSWIKMSIQEENFKICGLCSQLVDESVVNNETLRSFLGELLNVTEDSLPTKTCLECYKVCSDSDLQNILRFLQALPLAIQDFKN